MPEAGSDEHKLAGLAQLLGVLAALPVWLTWRQRSAFVRLHAVQSMLLDALMFAAIAILLAILAGGIVASVSLAEQPDASLAALTVLLFGFPLCSLAGMLVVITAVLLLRLRAAMAALQGREYRYPLIGRWG
ncbi:MAG: DUF4870 domain-containing protein [Thermoflexales bacterium]|nr:DUF4870 domain-containing protein [Thermoflexales bacterium]